uniref:Uncharacterized protein n=1 Tax=viral metagenome TaxID=1070528 RepID=A0A6C0AE88_9ZZZZ
MHITFLTDWIVKQNIICDGGVVDFYMTFKKMFFFYSWRRSTYKILSEQKDLSQLVKYYFSKK